MDGRRSAPARERLVVMLTSVCYVMRLICLLLIAALGSSCAGSKAAPTGVIAAVVEADSSGAPLPFAAVNLIRCDLEVAIEKGQRWRWQGAQELNAGRDARFERDVSPGSYLLRATYMGYLHETARIEVTAGDTANVIFRLRPQSRGQ
jgi:hypothetical protein